MNESMARYLGEVMSENDRAAARAFLWTRVVPLLAVLVFTVAWATKAYADPRFAVSTDKFRVTLYDEPCALKDQITNLPYKAVWEEAGKVYQGCWGPRPEVESIVVYFTDKTVGIIPFGALKPVTGA